MLGNRYQVYAHIRHRPILSSTVQAAWRIKRRKNAGSYQ
jgi:hypothetical protein